MKPGFAARAASLIWHMPGRAWAGALKAAGLPLWWRFGAAVMVSLMIWALIWIVWQGPWPDAAWSKRLDWLGWYGMAAWFALIICVVALFDFRLNFRASRQGIEANMAGDDDPAPPPVTVETTTTTTVAQPTAAPTPVAAEERPPWDRP